jgi:hypothetical protein
LISKPYYTKERQTRAAPRSIMSKVLLNNHFPFRFIFSRLQSISNCLLPLQMYISSVNDNPLSVFHSQPFSLIFLSHQIFVTTLVHLQAKYMQPMFVYLQGSDMLLLKFQRTHINFNNVRIRFFPSKSTCSNLYKRVPLCFGIYVNAYSFGVVLLPEPSAT